MAVQVREIGGFGGSFAEDLGGGIANVLDQAYKKKKYEAAEKQRNERQKVQDEFHELRMRSGEWELEQKQEAQRKDNAREIGAKELRKIAPEDLDRAISEETRTPDGTELGGPTIAQMQGGLVDAENKPLDTPLGNAYSELVSARGEEERKLKLAQDISDQAKDKSGDYMTLDEGQHASLGKAAQGLFKVGGRYKTAEIADHLQEEKKPETTSSGYGAPWYNKETQSYQQTHKVTGESRDAPGTGISTNDDGGDVLSKNFGQDANGRELRGQALMDQIRETDYSTAAKMEGLISGAFDPKALESMRGGRRSALFSLVYRATDDERFRAYNQADYQIRFDTRREFMVGKAAANVRSLNTAMGHAEDAINLGGKLDNTMLVDWNKLKNNLITRTGYTQVTNFDKAINALVAEAATLFKGTAGTDQEIQEWREQFNSSQSPEQIQEGVETLMHLFKSRMDALSNQYAQGMGREMQSDELLSDKSRKLFNKHALPADQIPDPAKPSSTPYNEDFSQLARNKERDVVEGMQVQMDSQNRGIVDPNMMNPNLGGGGAGAPPEVQWERGPDGRPRAVTPRI